MRRAWAALLTFAVVGAAVAMLAIDPSRAADWVGVAAVAIVGFVAIPLHIVVHEAGHLLVALLTGLRVVGVRISWRHDSAVLVVPSGPALPLRMAALILAGPLANLGGAALAWHLWRQPQPPAVRMAAAIVAVSGVLVGVANLLPIRLTPSSPDSDGRNLLRWVFRPRIATAAAVADPARLDAIIEKTSHPLVLLAAWMRRIEVAPNPDRMVATAERLKAIAYDPRTKPAHAGIIATHLALIFGTGYLHLGIVGRKPVDRANADEIIEIAELGFRLRPRDERARIALAAVRLLDHRAADARNLLANVRTATAGTHALATQLFALAEIYLGNRARADAALAAAGAGHPVLGEILAALDSADALPPLVAPAHSSGGSQSWTPGPSTGSGVVSAGAPPVIAASSPDGSTPLRP